MIERRLVDHDTHLLWFDAHRGDRGIGQCTTEVALLLLRSAFTEHDRDNRHSLSSPRYVFAEDLTGDDPLLDLVRPFVDFRDFHIAVNRSEEHTSELQSLMRISYAVFCLKKKK